MRILTRVIALVMAFTIAAPGVATSKSKSKTPRTKARQAILIALPGDRVLLRKRASRRMAPSSMVKLMAIYLVFERLRDGRAALGDQVEVSASAVRTRGSRIGLKAGDKVSLENLLRGVIVYSGNDAALALAEHFGASEAKFAAMMTARAKALGLATSRFKSATGFTAKGQYMSANDLARLAARTINDFPLFYLYFRERRFTFRGKIYRNRNPVLGRVAGADGLKTGQTRAGGYGLVVSAERRGVRLILVINGLRSAKARAREAVRLLEWGFRKVGVAKSATPKQPKKKTKKK